AGNENIISIWQLSGVCVSSYIGHQGTIQSLFWSPQDDMIISGDEHHQIHCWKPRNGKQLRVETLPGEWSSDCKILVQAFSPQGKYLATLDDNRYACLRPFHLASNREDILSHWKHMSRHQALGSTLSWSPAGDRLAWGFRDGSVWLWNVPHRPTRPGGSYQAHKSCVNAIAWSSTDKVIATSSEEGTVHLWSVTPKGAQRLIEGRGSTTFIYKGHAKTVKALAWSPVGEQLASAGSDGSIHIWHAAR
ncbi:MAG TPA: hypothetical protein VFN35_14545, partial [Ktedonobacteraceae bacterium]|nr:hypothetical protein [Ktedonobacteraceae bacterium]